MHETQNDGSARYLVFEQSKYGIEGTSLAVVGGLTEFTDTTPLAAAQRELNEEMGREAGSMVPLGCYRTDVNRGGGYVCSFLALDTVPAPPERRLSSDDLEPQDVVALTRAELQEALLASRFKEVKWSNTVALALLCGKAPA